jgi:large subunit ribosomal protein L31
MKAKIHPIIYEETKVTCSCGNTFTTRSTKPNITIEVCSNCHPYFTGEHRFIDTKGRVEDFQKKQEIAKKIMESSSSKKKFKKEKKEQERPKTLKELLSEV